MVVSAAIVTLDSLVMVTSVKILMNVLLKAHVQSTPIVKIVLVAFHVNHMMVLKLLWLTVFFILLISTNAKLVITTVTLLAFVPMLKVHLNVLVQKVLKVMVSIFVSETSALMVLILAVPILFVLTLTWLSRVSAWKASGAIRMAKRALIANKTKQFLIFQAKPEMLSTSILKSSLMTKNHSRPRKLAEMLPKCSRMPLEKLIARTKRVKHVLEQLSKKIFHESELLLIKSLMMFSMAFIRLNPKLVNKLSVL